MKKVFFLIILLFVTSCDTTVARKINRMKAPAIIVMHNKPKQLKPHVIIRDSEGDYYEIYDDIFTNCKVGDTVKF
jgi:hypothetical protein